MDSQTRILTTAIIVVSLGVLAIILQPTIEERLAPELRTAWVAYEIDGNGVAEIGPVNLDSDTPFTLHAIVEAERNGEPVYYTEAKALRFHGQDVPTERLRRWKRPLDPRVRWFTVEGTPPYLELASSEDLERFRFQELYRPGWPLAWSIPGTIELARDDHLQDESAVTTRPFGIQRFHVSVEFYDQIDEMRPKKTVRSWRAADLEGELERYPTVRRRLPGRLGAASEVFGLTQLEVVNDAGDSPELLLKIDDLARKDLAFSRATVIRDQLQASGKKLEDLIWQDVDLVEGQYPWSAIEPGDLMRVGERFVVLYEDREPIGRLDYDDLCFDYVHGAQVRRLGDVFSGDGLVELASLDTPGNL